MHICAYFVHRISLHEDTLKSAKHVPHEIPFGRQLEIRKKFNCNYAKKSQQQNIRKEICNCNYDRK